VFGAIENCTWGENDGRKRREKMTGGGGDGGGKLMREKAKKKVGEKGEEGK
jgi:hypothetical protein